MAISEETAGHRATLRVLAILDALAANQKGLTMAEICRELGAPKSSLFPILHTMADTEYIAYDEETMRYSIGLRTYLLSKAFDRGAMGLPLIEGEMRRVVGTCNETCQAGTLDHGRVLYIARVDSPQRIRLSSEIGKTLPAHCTAIGKAILSQLSDAEAIDSLVLPLERPTEHARGAARPACRDAGDGVRARPPGGARGSRMPRRAHPQEQRALFRRERLGARIPPRRSKERPH